MQYTDSWFAPVFGKNGACSFLTQTQLCPAVWGIVIGLLSTFYFKVCGAEASELHQVALRSSHMGVVPQGLNGGL